ncbi:MAG: hypothetical protein JWR60_1422 [Polaromonas sp.]|nr:hypothetical protein [Polaromonas sp.]
MSDKSAALEKACQDENEAREIEREHYRLMMLQLKAFQSGNGTQPEIGIFQDWKASMQERLALTLFRVDLVKP